MLKLKMARQLGKTFQKLVVNRVTQNFKDAVEKVRVPFPEVGPNDILVRNRFLGVNASDINFSAGRYEKDIQPPFDCGFEGIGEVVAVGSDCHIVQVGQPVAYMRYGAFAEYKVMPAKYAFSLPEAKAEYLPFILSGATANISLEKIGLIKPKEVVLVSAAAGGTGQFAVQLAKSHGCHVIGLCSSPEKVEFLKQLGCDRPINYNEEKLHTVLKNEYPNGVNVVYESVGGDVFDVCIDRLAKHGRLIIIGFISGYETELGIAKQKSIGLPSKLLTKSASARGFFLFNHMRDVPVSIMKLVQMYENGRIKSTVDTGARHPNGPFVGLDSITTAVDYLFAKKNMGKIVVELPPSEESKL